MQTLSVDLVSDVVCPWCAIGFEQLRRAIDALEGELRIERRWHAFLLNPDAPPEGRDMLPHLAAKYGMDTEGVRASQARIRETAESLGLHFEKMAERRAWNTFDTHRVLAWAREHGADEAFNLALFDAYFGEARNPTDPALLEDIADRLGLDGTAVAGLLAGEDYAVTVRQEIEDNRRRGVSAVPAFIVDGEYLVSGAQPVEALIDVFRQIAERRVDTA